MSLETFQTTSLQASYQKNLPLACRVRLRIIKITQQLQDAYLEKLDK